MRLRKLFLGVSITALALFVLAGFGTGSAKAAETDAAGETSVSIKDVTVSCDTKEIIIKENETANKDNKLYLGVGTYSGGAYGASEGEGLEIKVKKWVEYDCDVKGEKSVVIDISSIFDTSNQHFVIKGDVNTKPLVIVTNGARSGLSASIDYTNPDDPKLVLKDKYNYISDNVEFATGNGVWQKYNAKSDSKTGTVKTDLTVYQKFGATLKVREAATTASWMNNPDGLATINKTVTVDYYHVTNGFYASKEVKVKIPKLAAGPRVLVNYTNNTVSIPKTAEYRTKVGNDYKTTVLKDATKSTVVVPLADFNLSGAATIDVRTAAKVNNKDVTKSKSASHITEVVIPKIEKLSVKLAADGEGKAAYIDKDNFGTADLEKITANGKVTFKYGTKSGTATLTSTDTDNVYEVYVTRESTVGVVEGKLVTPASTVKGVKKLNAAKTLKLTKLKDGDKIFIHKAGNKKKKVFASEFAAFGTVKFPTATATPMPTALASTGA